MLEEGSSHLPAGRGIRFWLHVRQPCVGLLLCGVAAILIADGWTIPPLGVLSALILAAIGWLFWPRLPFVWIIVFGAIFVRHELTRISPGRDLAVNFVDGQRLVHGTGIVLDEPRAIESLRNIPRSRFTIQLESLGFESEHPCSAKAAMIWVGAMPGFGDRVTFRGDAQNIAPPRNPGQFDYAKLLQRRSIFSEIHLRYPNDGNVVSSGHGNPLTAFAQTSRRWLQQKLTVDLEESPDAAGLVQSMVLGLKDETPEETREMFQRTGTLHLFVVNGLHVGMFALIVWFVLKPLGVTRRQSVFIIIPLLAFYALVTGLSPGSVRATLMAAIVLGGLLAERNPLSFNSLAMAALVILLWDTNELFMPGFQFSFGVVFTIMALAGPLRRKLISLALPDPFLPRLLWSRIQNARVAGWQRLATLIAVTTSASIGSSPFTATYFHLLSPSALLANLLVVPLALGVLFEGVLSVFLGTIWGFLSTLFNNVNWILAQAILLIIRFFAQLPGGYVFLELPQKHAVCEVTVLDLGAGAAAHVRSAGRDWLIDCGNDFSYTSAVRPLLRSRGTNRLDGLVLTHGDVAHIGAAALALADFSPEEIVDSAVRDRSSNRRAFHAELAAKGLGKSICGQGDLLHIAPGIEARVLYPPPGIEARTADDKALVLQLNACGTRVLFMSDSGFATERWLLDHAENLRSEILVKGQHGSDLSGTPDFISAVRPRAIVCSSAIFPASERVPEDWAAEMAARGIELFRQDQSGAVEIAIEPDGWRVRAFLGDHTFSSRSE